MLPIWDTINNFWQLLLLYQKLQRLCTPNVVVLFIPTAMLTTNVAKSHGKRSLFSTQSHSIFSCENSLETPLHCLLLSNNIVKIDLIPSSHFLASTELLSKLIFYSILWLFCSHVKTPYR